MADLNPVVTGLGFITSIGLARDAVADSLRDGRHGLQRVNLAAPLPCAVKVAGPVPGFEVSDASWRRWRWPERYAIPRETVRGLAPHGVYAWCALQQALEHAGLAAADLTDGQTGLFCASAGSAFLMHRNVEELRANRFARSNPLAVVNSIAGTLNFNLAAHFKIAGAVTGFASACASSSHAIGYAMDEIRLGRQERMLVVGAEDLNAESLLPFDAMGALSHVDEPAQASRPFDVGRDGFVGTGGAAALVIEAAGVAARRGAHPLARLAGWGQAADGYSIATSHPEGAGLRSAMQRALRDAGVTPGAVDYVNAHATSTPVGDRAEARALRGVFTAAGARPAVSSTKGLTGHGLSLAGVMEAGFCVLALERGFIPGNPHLVTPDPECEGLDLPVASRPGAPRVVLNNSSGFGGSNVCHVLVAP